MDSDSDLLMSQRSMDLLDGCVYELPSLQFDAINSPVLLAALVDEEGTGLYDYLEKKSTDDEIQDALELLQNERSDDLKTFAESAKNEGAQPNSESNSEKEDEPSNSGADSKKEGALSNQEPISESGNFVIFKDKNQKRHQYPISDELVNVFIKLGEICEEHKIEVFEPEHILLAMFEEEDGVLKDLFDHLLQISFKKAKAYFSTALLNEKSIIPHNLSGFMECLNDKVDPTKPCEILGRDKEVEKIWNISLKRNKRNTIIVGEAGVGKSALIDKIAYDIATGACPEEFKGFSVIGLDVNALIAGTTYRGQAEERIKELISFLKEMNNIILFIDEAHTILGAGSCHEGEMDLSNALKPILARGETIVICATTMNEYLMYFAQDSALSRRFERVEVEEPNSDEVWPMIKNKVKALQEYHGVKISESMVEFAIMIANCFAFEKKNPDKTLDLIDRSMVVAKRNGKGKVDKESIMANFNIYFELYEGMNEDSRKEVAYHEAGHYIAFKALAESIVEVRLLAVSILPAEDYLGVTCYENRRDRMPFRNKEYFINHLAVNLAGRAAEKVFRKDFTSGAGQDLKIATALAYRVITSYGFNNKEDEGNNVFLNTPDYPMLSEKSVNEVNDAVQEMVSIAYKRAEKIIDDNMDFLKAMVKKLLARGIMSEKELDKLWVKYQERKQK